MQKWAYFTMGVMAGMIVLLVHALIMQHHDNPAYARQGSDNSGKGIVMATGGSQSSIQDIVWILHEHQPLQILRPEGDEGKELRKENRLTLLLYRCENQAKSMRLVAARDLSYDEEMTDYMTEKPKAQEIFAELKKVAERNKKKEDK